VQLRRRPRLASTRQGRRQSWFVTEGEERMQAVIAVFCRFVVRNDGQDLTEYGLLAALIAIVALAAVSTLGSTIQSVLWAPIAANF
jgi:Flp pilus assembly pilin Flp